MNNASTSTSSEDEIVKEIPIYNSKRLQKQLYLLQYPLLSNKSTNSLNIRKGLFKPNNQEMELEMEIDVESKNFDPDRAQLTAEEIDGPPETRKIGTKVHFENDLVDKVFLKGMKPVEDPTVYAALTYTGKEVHLTTLQNIFQLRPSFAYLNQKRKKKDVDHNDLSDEEDDSPSSAEAITVKFKQGNDRFKKEKADSQQTHEAWTTCQFHSEGSSLSKLEAFKLLAENMEQTFQGTSLTKNEYLRVLIPKDEGPSATTEQSNASNIMSLDNLHLLSTQEQRRILLKDAQIIQFQHVKMILSRSAGLSADILLRTLPTVAVLVRGNWVVKSDIVYPKDTFTSHGVPAESMCRARDYVLYLFTKNQYVERKKVSSAMKIPPEEVKEIFMGFSTPCRNKGWELKFPIDSDFIQKHSEIVQKQSDAWEQRWKHITQFLNDNHRQRRKSKSVSEENKSRNGTNCVSSDNDSGTEKNKSPMFARKKKNT